MNRKIYKKIMILIHISKAIITLLFKFEKIREYMKHPEELSNLFLCHKKHKNQIRHNFVNFHIHPYLGMSTECLLK